MKRTYAALCAAATMMPRAIPATTFSAFGWTAPNCTFTTGGGYIAGSQSAGNGKANFGFNARPSLLGHLNYVDHTAGMFIYT